MSEFYEGRQFVGMDLHRRRSVLVRMSETGEHLETVRILNDRDVLAEVKPRSVDSSNSSLTANPRPCPESSRPLCVVDNSRH